MKIYMWGKAMLIQLYIAVRGDICKFLYANDVYVSEINNKTIN